MASASPIRNELGFLKSHLFPEVFLSFYFTSSPNNLNVVIVLPLRQLTAVAILQTHRWGIGRGTEEVNKGLWSTNLENNEHPEPGGARAKGNSRIGNSLSEQRDARGSDAPYCCFGWVFKVSIVVFKVRICCTFRQVWDDSGMPRWPLVVSQASYSLLWDTQGEAQRALPTISTLITHQDIN